MNRIRSITAGALGLVVVAGGAVASGAVTSPDLPPVKPLATALHDAIDAPPVKGITARITFTNKLIDSSNLSGGSPLLVGASGRLWLSADGRARIELQSDRGDAQIVSDGKKVTIYDASSNTAYVAALPQDAADHHTDDPASTTPPSVDKISDVLAKVGKAVDLAGPHPTAVAGQSAYSVKITPHNGGLVGKAEIAWDAITGVPLRAGIYAKGTTEPVIELSASDIAYGPVDEAALSVPVPAGAKVETIDVPSTGDDASSDHQALTPSEKADRKASYEKLAKLTPSEVAKALPFKLSAPDTLAGMPRTKVRLLSNIKKGATDQRAALITYGVGLGGIAVLESPAKAAAPNAAAPSDAPSGTTGSGDDNGFGHHGSSDGPALQIPTIDIGGAKATELSTALGTILRFQRGGVQYTVIGSVTGAVAEAAARGL